MSGFGAQDALAALLAALALGWLVLRRVRAARRGRGGACADCPSASPVPGARPAPMPEVLVSIGDPPAPGARGR